jgi:hypothetical protein
MLLISALECMTALFFHSRRFMLIHSITTFVLSHVYPTLRPAVPAGVHQPSTDLLYAAFLINFCNALSNVYLFFAMTIQDILQYCLVSDQIVKFPNTAFFIPSLRLKISLRLNIYTCTYHVKFITQ